jgi:hypothetical protein
MQNSSQLVVVLSGKPMDLYFARDILTRVGIDAIIFDEGAYYATHRVDARLMVPVSAYQKARAELKLSGYV